jgi:hypothetical protein
MSLPSQHDPLEVKSAKGGVSKIDTFKSRYFKAFSVLPKKQEA